MLKITLILSLFTSLSSFASESLEVERTVINCVKKASLDFKISTNTKTFTLGSYSGFLHSELKRCLRSLIKNNPKSLAPILNKYKTREKESLEKSLNTMDYNLFDKISNGHRFKNCYKEIKKIRPKQAFFHRQNDLDKLFQKLCIKYEGFIIKHKKSP